MALRKANWPPAMPGRFAAWQIEASRFYLMPPASIAFFTSSIEAPAVSVSAVVLIDVRCPLSPTRISSAEPSAFRI
jgi:hypothetical protein